jgi:hypothetical protein
LLEALALVPVPVLMEPVLFVAGMLTQAIR